MKRRAKRKPAADPAKCPACGLPYEMHPGIIGTCQALQNCLRHLGTLLAVAAHYKALAKKRARKK